MRKKGGQTIIFILALAGAGFFCGQMLQILHSNDALAASQGDVLINEIMYNPHISNVGHEWIEIYNISKGSVDLTGWKFYEAETNHGLNLTKGDWVLPVGGYAIIADNADQFLIDHLNFNGTIFDSSFSLNNTSETIAIKDGSKAVINEVTYQANWGGNGNGRTIERQNDSWSESLIDGGTPGVLNSILAPDPPEEQPFENNTASTTPAQTENTAATSTENTATPLTPLVRGKINNFGDVVINEIVSDPGDNEVEWLELYNNTIGEIDLSGWRIEDGSKAKTNLNGTIGIKGFKVIEKPAGVLNNDGDLIVLYDVTGKIIDQAAYGNWNDGDLGNNAPVAHDPNSLARLFDGYNSYNNLNDFAVTIKPTKGTSNIIQAEDEVSLEARAKFDYSADIQITEILPNPIGDDAKLEFIEIYNAGKRDVNLTGWSLSNEDGKKNNLETMATSSTIKAGEYLALYRPKTKIVLHNDQGEVRLYQPLEEKPLQTAAYKNVKEGWSYNLIMNNPPSPPYQGGEWVWSEIITPGAANIFKTVNHAPEAAFSLPAEILIGQPAMFDSSDTMDADGDDLKYVWDFGDGMKNTLVNPEHTYLKIGIYKVKLSVSDGKETAEKEKSVKVVVALSKANITPLSPPLSGGIVINEIFPNPAGADTGQEWLELKNQSEAKINLINWRVENSNGKFKFKNDLWLDAANFYLLADTESKLALKNSSDTLNMYNDLAELADTVEYADAVQDESYARGANGNWFWTTKLTPGQENAISVAESNASINYQVAGVKISSGVYAETTLEKIRELEVGSLVKVKGTVAVLPGILGAQIFYIVGSPGMQIYNYKKDFPSLQIGDYIEVSGELTQAQGELRLKTKDQSDIKIAEHKTPPVALAVSCDQVNEENIGQLISVSGEITDKKSSTLYLDDGNDEILVYIKQATGISTKNLSAGQKAAVTGIISKTQSGLRLMPRSQADIKLINSSGELAPQVLGEVAAAGEWEVAARDKKIELFKYLIILAGGGIIILAGLLIRSKRKV